MQEIGRIAEILSDRLALAELRESATPNTIVTVFSRSAPEPTLAQKYQLEHIDIPKGELRILARQKGNLYLLESFRETIERTEVIRPMENLLSGIMGMEVRKQQAFGPASASLSAPTMPIKFRSSVEVGDLIALNV